MTTRAGLVGVLSGVLLAALLYTLMFTWADAVVFNGTLHLLHWVLQGSFAVMLILTGYIAARWNQSRERWRCISLGSLAGVMAGTFLFALWGAAFVGLKLSAIQNISVSVILQFTIAEFFILFLAGGLFGGLGGFFYYPGKTRMKDTFNKVEPQMAMNAAITAVSASVVACAIAASTFPALAVYLGNRIEIPGPYFFPLVASLVLLVVSQYALTLVVPHETEQAEHVSGMDEVKMAAFVDIATAPLLLILLLVIDHRIVENLFIIVLIVCSFMMSLYSVRALIKVVLPKRSSYPKHPTTEQKTQTALFGSIANSKAWRLVTLCIGCGMAMVFPIYISVLAPLININRVYEYSQPITLYSEPFKQIIWAHIKTSMGLNLIVIGVLSAMYIFYLNLGKWFTRRKTR